MATGLERTRCQVAIPLLLLACHEFKNVTVMIERIKKKKGYTFYFNVASKVD